LQEDIALNIRHCQILQKHVKGTMSAPELGYEHVPISTNRIAELVSPTETENFLSTLETPELRLPHLHPLFDHFLVRIDINGSESPLLVPQARQRSSLPLPVEASNKPVLIRGI
jgi:hypothetical protein